MLTIRSKVSLFVLVGSLASFIAASSAQASFSQESVYTHQKVSEKKGEALIIFGDPEYPVSQIRIEKITDLKTGKRQLNLEFSGDSFRLQQILKTVCRSDDENCLTFNSHQGRGSVAILRDGEDFNQTGLDLLQKCLVSINAEESLRKTYEGFSEEWLKSYFEFN